MIMISFYQAFGLLRRIDSIIGLVFCEIRQFIGLVFCTCGRSFVGNLKHDIHPQARHPSSSTTSCNTPQFSDHWLSLFPLTLSVPYENRKDERERLFAGRSVVELIYLKIGIDGKFKLTYKKFF